MILGNSALKKLLSLWCCFGIFLATMGLGLAAEKNQTAARPADAQPAPDSAKRRPIRPTQEAEKPDFPPLLRITPLPDGRFLLEPLRPRPSCPSPRG
jgi:hypothetical protein